MFLVIKKVIKKILIKSLKLPLSLLRNHLMTTPYIHGDNNRVHLGKDVSLLNATLNTASGEIFIGDNTIFGHNCNVITGTHIFVNGMRKKLSIGGPEAPTSGRDIIIGKGCFIGSNVTINGKVNIGDNTIIGAGSVVTKDIPPGAFAAGIPAKIIRLHS